jgi:L-ascorbate metabolism protein UlaG (beta-lactamase superfamily)
VSGGSTLTWLGASCFRLETPAGKAIYVDPWLQNPNCPPDERTPRLVDVIAVTHGHYDHLGETVALAKRHGPVLLAITELAQWLKGKDVGGSEVKPMNIGGSREVFDVRVSMVDARHSSSVWPIGADSGEVVGSAAGFVFVLGDATVYVAGDTGPFLDMKLIARQYAPDVAVLPIGDGTTMGPSGAALALELLGAKVCVPCHFDHPSYAGQPDDLRKLTHAHVVTPAPGESLDLSELVRRV